MKYARNQYRYAIRRVKKKERTIRLEQLAEAASSDNSRDFFTEVKKLKPKNACAPNVNGLTCAKDIANHFAEKYESLYNKHTVDQNCTDQAKEYIANGLKDYLLENIDFKTSPSDIANVVKKLKKNKSDGDVGFNSSHLIIGGNNLMTHLSGLVQAMFIHGHQAKCLLRSTIVSIPKDARGNLCDDANYRGIALCNAIGKVVDYIIIERNQQKLKTSSLQFAYKSRMGTTLCSLVVKEIIGYYLQRGSNVYSSCLDMSKAFDLVKHDLLFSMLIKRGFPSLDLRILMDSYARQKVRTSWSGYYSKTFSCSNGIRQGAITSPILFCIYVDELLQRLEQNESGCWIGPYYSGAVCYADDIMLLSPSMSGLKDMVSICESYALEFGMTFNSSKSVCIRFGYQVPQRPLVLKLGSSEIKWETSIKHLGNYLHFNLSEERDVAAKKRDFYGRVNNLLSILHDAPEKVVLKIFSSKCCHFYGLQAWRLSDKHITQFYTAWNRAVRLLLRLHPATHRRFLPSFTGWDVKVRVTRSILGLIRKIKTHQDCFIKFVGRQCSGDQRSIIGSNETIAPKLLDDQHEMISKCDKSNLEIVLELRECLNGTRTLNLETSEIEEIIKTICID